MAESDQGKRIVLVIDDDEAIRLAVHDILETIGIPVLAAEGGGTGLKLFGAHRREIGLIILDYSMPGLTGEQTLSRLRAIDSEIPIVISTGYSASELRSWDDAKSIQEFLPKPYRMSDLIDMVTRYLALPSSPKSLTAP